MVIVSMEFERSRIPIIQPCSERNAGHLTCIACIVRTVSFVWAVIHPFGGDWLCSFVNAYHSAMCRRYVARVLIVPNKPCIVVLRDVAAPCHERRGAAAQRNQLLSYIPFHYIKHTRIKKVAVTIILS